MTARCAFSRCGALSGDRCAGSESMMRNLDGRSIAVGVLIGVAATVSVGAANIPPSSPKCPWRLEMSRTTAEAWRLNTGTGQLEACMVALGGELPNPLTGAQCMPMPAPEAPSSVIDHDAKEMYRLYHRMPRLPPPEAPVR